MELEFLGIALKDQVYPDSLGLSATVFPDGQLIFFIPALATAIVRVVREREVQRVFTPGHTGCDGHRDHIAVHRAAMLAARWLGVRGVRLEVWAQIPGPYSEAPPATLWIPATAEIRARRLGAMACDKTQFMVRILDPGEDPAPGELAMDGYAVDREFWQVRFKPYHHLVEYGEGYELVYPFA